MVIIDLSSSCCYLLVSLPFMFQKCHIFHRICINIWSLVLSFSYLPSKSPYQFPPQSFPDLVKSSLGCSVQKPLRHIIFHGVIHRDRCKTIRRISTHLSLASYETPRNFTSFWTGRGCSHYLLRYKFKYMAVPDTQSLPFIFQGPPQFQVSFPLPQHPLSKQ